MLKISRLTKKFGDVTALHSLTLQVKSGEVLALLGPNGSGKTTTVKLVAGLLQATSGIIEINGHSIKSEVVAAKQRLGYVPDEPFVWSGMTGEEFLHFTGALYGLDEPTRTARIPALLEHFSLATISQQSFEDYSRGNKQKFTLLAALLHRPEVLLVDEPIVGLDPASVTVAERLFRQFATDGGALLLVTHSLAVAERVADRVGILVYGELRALGTIAQLREQAHLSDEAGLDQIYAALTA